MFQMNKLEDDAIGGLHAPEAKMVFHKDDEVQRVGRRRKEEVAVNQQGH